MTSIGLKRPLEVDIPSQNTTSSSSADSNTSTQSVQTPPPASTPVASIVISTNDGSTSRHNGKNPPSNNNYHHNHHQQQDNNYHQSKRRCNSYNVNHHPHYYSTHSRFRSPSTLLRPVKDQVSAFLKDELNKYSSNTESVTFTIEQTQEICENIIKTRELKLVEEYDKVLQRQLNEQYEMFMKASYLSSLESRYSPTPPAQPSISSTSQAFSALASAISSIQRSSSAAANNVVQNTTIPDLPNFSLSLSNPTLESSQIALNFQQRAASLVQAQQRGSNNNALLGPVLLASNLDEQLANPEALFTLFGVFGDVIRVKILFNKKDNALVQMADATQAQVAQSNLDKQKVFGKLIRVTRSKHQVVQMPRDQSDAGLTQDFTNSTLHRFKIPGSRNYLNIYPPSNTLHISNIPITITEEEIKHAFREACNFDCETYKFFPKDRKMALMKFDSIEYATIALIKMHNYQISEDNHLRVSFSKSIVQH